MTSRLASFNPSCSVLRLDPDHHTARGLTNVDALIMSNSAKEERWLPHPKEADVLAALNTADYGMAE